MVAFIFYCNLVMVCCESMELVRVFFIIILMDCFHVFNLCYFIFIFYIL